MLEIGRVCMKIAGRDAGKYCVIVDILDEKTILIDGQTRRRKCNLVHIEPVDNVVKIAKNADHNAVVNILKTINITCDEKSNKEKKQTVRQKRSHMKKEKVLKGKKTQPEKQQKKKTK